MTYNQIKYFLMVAEYLNFSEAARHLYMSQPALGRQITALEKELGIQLLVRTTRGLKLTPAGSFLCEKWTEIMQDFEDTVKQASKINEGYSGKVLIGILENVNVSLFLTDMINKFEKLYPNIQLQLRRYSFGELRDKLSAEKVDAIITYSMDIQKMQGIQSINLLKMHLAWAVPYTNPLSASDEVSCSNFKDQELIITGESDCSFGEKMIVDFCKKFGGFYPKLYYVDTVEETMLRLESGSRCSLLNMELSIAQSKKVKMFPVREKQGNGYISLAWRADSNNISLKLLTDMISENVKERI